MPVATAAPATPRRRQKRGPPNPHRLRHGPRWSYQFATLVHASPRPTCCGPKAQRDPAHPTSGFGRLDAFDGTRNFLFARLRKADQQGNFGVNTDNIVKLDAPVRFPALWSRKASPPEPVEAYREQPQRFPPVLGLQGLRLGRMDVRHQHGDPPRWPAAISRGPRR